MARHDLPRPWLLSRRSFLAASTSSLLVASRGWCGDEIVVRRPSLGATPFTLGVASGDPDPRGFVLWTRLAPKPLEGGGMPRDAVAVGWEVAEDEGFGKVVRRGESIAVPQLAHAVHVEVDGLEPDRWYWYRFHVGSDTSPVGHARTVPAVDAAPEKLRFAFASCQHFESGLYTAYEHMAKEDLDLVIHLGDYIYEGAGKPGGVRQHIGGELRSLEDYRTRHAQYKTDTLLQAMHARCPWLVTWDDHEVANNYAADIAEDKGVDPHAFLRQRASAYQAYYEHMPLRHRAVPTGPDMALYRRVRFGQLAEFNVLDTRQYRSDQPNGDGGKPLKPGALDPNQTMLGRKQEGWLCRGMIQSPCRWNVLAQQVMMARVDFKPGDGGTFSMDQWSGCDAARNRLLDFIATRRVANPIVLTGDIHSNWCNDLLVNFDDRESKPVASEFVGTSISSGGNGGGRVADARSGVLAENPFVKFQNNERGYVSCTVTPSSWRSDYQVVEFVTTPGAPMVTRASFVVENGRAGVQPA
ncbi:MAG: alkaline phosphatase D family protein [Pirellulales bacterium]|nr:alkaline phosphatase D family protein [Pirellulales bacterium]